MSTLFLDHPFGKFLVYESIYLVPLTKNEFFGNKVKISANNITEEFGVVPAVIKLKMPLDSLDAISECIYDVGDIQWPFEYAKNYDINNPENPAYIRKYTKAIVSRALKNFKHIVDESVAPMT